ncbi:hypothetical protein V5O48_000562 [Marasmius crinis-equi]|uniref:Uncharacterized protein n=1 Tax=Marasmius crinis-equi TaxID=585013 RepID=A0ABR3G102_9AGAR
MPGPAVYIVVAVVSTVAAGFAFKHFVYDPHIAPKVDVWRHEMRTRREARRRRRQGPMPVAVDLNNPRDDRRSDTSSSEDDDDAKADRQSYELESMVSKEVMEWRNDVDRAGTLRQRKMRSNVDSPPIASGSSTSWSLHEDATPGTIPAHVLFDSSSEATSTVPTRHSSPLSGQVSTLRSSTSRSTLRSPLPSNEVRTAQLVQMEVSPPTPAPSNFSFTGSDGRTHTVASSSSPTPAAGFNSPNLVPSLSLSHPVDLDREHDVELLSAPSSRPDSPFSNLSQPSSVGGFSATSSNEARNNPAHITTSPIVPPPGITQLLSPPNLAPPPSSPQSFSEISSFYQTPTTTIPGSGSVSRTQSELDFLSFDGDNSARSLSSDDIASMSSHDRMSVGSFNDTDEEGYDDARDARSEFGGSEISVGSSWGGLSESGSRPGSPRVARR